MHVGDAAKFALQGCRQNDDGDLRTLAAEGLGYIRAELAGAEMIVDYRDIDEVQFGLGFYDGAGVYDLISLLAQDSGAQHEVFFAVVEQQDANRRDCHRLRPSDARWSRIGGFIAHRYAVRTISVCPRKIDEHAAASSRRVCAEHHYYGSFFWGSGSLWWPAIRLRTVFASSGSLVKIPTARNHCLWSKAGEPLTVAPAGMSPWVPLWAVTTTPSPMLQCPATPTWPARMTFFPTTVEPARPTCEQSSVWSPTAEPCPTCTRLSILAPRPTRVSPMLARSMQEFACTSTSLSSTAGPDCVIFSQRSPSRANPKPSQPTTAPFCRITLSPSVQFSRTTAWAWAKKLLPTRAPR